ncbi:DUF7500 family protein [Natronomonas sp. EA1]|uniref:DUF7500 family protein n=1 Tax=Natronomonas sp. EA1 TaxID=3421655 RepID=UPI003EC098D7
MSDDGDDGILRPEDLRLDDDRVRRLEDGRIVVSTDEETGTGPAASPDSDSPADPAAHQSEPAALVDFLPEEDAYELAVAIRTDHATAELTVGSNDIREPFVDLLRWYAAQVKPEFPPEAVLQTLIESSDLALSVERTGEE